MQIQPRDFVSRRQHGAQLQLCVPQVAVKAFSYRRVKNDERDAADLADLLRMGRLPEAWIAPAEVRELRELTRYRQKVVGLRTSCKDQVHAVLAKLGVPVTCTDIFGTAGSAWLDGLRLPQPYAGKVTSLRQLAGELSAQTAMLSAVIAGLLAGDRGYQVIQQLPGIGPVLAAVIIAEIGDVTRFGNAGQLCSWAGLTPRHRESDTKVTRGHVTKQGSRVLRWAVIEAIQRVPRDSVIGSAKEALIARRGKQARNIAKVAAARRLLTLIFYGMRDGQIRCLSAPGGPPPPAQPPAQAA
jgi:transposase